MGCSTSKVCNGRGSKRYNRRPKISIRIQPGVQQLETNPLVIFIFGELANIFHNIS